MTGLVDTLGRPIRDLRVSVTDRCNFRCTYCMPREVFGHDYRFLPRQDLLTFEEITRVATLADLAAGRLLLLTSRHRCHTTGSPRDPHAFGGNPARCS